MMQEFSERAAECLRLARRTFSPHDQKLFEAMARAFAGEEKGKAGAHGVDRRRRYPRQHTPSPSLSEVSF